MNKSVSVIFCFQVILLTSFCFEGIAQTTDIKKLISKSHHFLRQSNDSCLILTDYIRKHSLQKKDFDAYAEATAVESQFYFYAGKKDTTEILLTDCYERFKNKINSTNSILILDRLANINLNNGKYQQALNFALRADSVAVKAAKNENRCQFNHKITLGNINQILQNTHIAEQHFLDALDCAKSRNHRFGIMASLYNYLTLYKTDLTNPKHSEYINDFAEISLKVKNNKLLFHGQLLSFLDSNTDHEPILKKCYEHQRALKKGQVPVLFAYLNTLGNKGKYTEALKLINAEKELANNRKDLTTYLILNNLASEYYEKINDHKSAYANLKNMVVIQDSINSSSIKKELLELQVKYETTQKENEILEKSVVIERKENQNKLLILGLISLGLFTIITSLYVRNRNKNRLAQIKNRLELEEEKVKNHKRKEKLLALEYTIMGQEEERKRIAQDLHDGLGGLLSTVKAHINTIHQELEALRKINTLDKTNELVDTACSEVRRISHNMMPTSLHKFGLTTALKEISYQMKNIHGLEVATNFDDIEHKLNDTQKIFIYRIFQEITNNIIKYAEAKNVMLQLNSFENEINILVEDDGKGMDLAHVNEHKGIGLKSISSRVRYLNGTMDLESTEGSGTSFSINIPIT